MNATTTNTEMDESIITRAEAIEIVGIDAVKAVEDMIVYPYSSEETEACFDCEDQEGNEVVLSAFCIHHNKYGYVITYAVRELDDNSKGMKTPIRKYTPEAAFLSPNRGETVVYSYALAIEDDVILCKVEDRSIRPGSPNRISYSAYKLPDSFYVDPDDFECECDCEDEEDCTCERPQAWEFNPNYEYPELGEYLGECKVVGDD